MGPAHASLRGSSEGEACCFSRAQREPAHGLAKPCYAANSAPLTPAGAGCPTPPDTWSRRLGPPLGCGEDPRAVERPRLRGLHVQAKGRLRHRGAALEGALVPIGQRQVDGPVAAERRRLLALLARHGRSRMRLVEGVGLLLVLGDRALLLLPLDRLRILVAHGPPPEVRVS